MSLFKKSLPDLSVLNSLHRKLNPSRFPRMTPLMSAIVGFVLDARFGDHAIGEIMVTCDGVVLADLKERLRPTSLALTMI